MFCYQCEEAAKGCGCTVKGVCGKDESTAALQDCLIYAIKGLSLRNIEARKDGKESREAGNLIAESLFAALTNVNFDNERLYSLITKAVEIRDSLPETGCSDEISVWKPENIEDAIKKGSENGVLATENEDVRSLRELLIYGLKGVGAYYYHVVALGSEDKEVTDFMEDALASTAADLSIDEMVGWVLKCGEIGVKVLEGLDRANTTAYGNPEITTVSTSSGSKPGILITGHDLKDLEQLLVQTENSGVDVYTHGEMLPAHAYPGLKKYSNLIGNYGGSWPHQRQEFESFNGPVLVTTNCLVPPAESYINRVYTTGPTGFSGVKHITEDSEGNKDFSDLIEHAKKCSSPDDITVKGEGYTDELITGCAHHAVLSIADAVIDAVKQGQIKRFIVMAGCDGRQKEREYYTEFAKALPQDAVILTAGCAKYRYNNLDLGDIGGIPRVIDAGQCNDCYSLVVIAKALADAFGTDLNGLPVSYNIAWYEQKAVLVLLSLLHLGVKDITLGPKLPAFVSPAVLNVLVENFGIRANTTVEEDMKIMMP
ncbi:hydroxylamine reductase [Methanoplanus endosymbiosus]|uniref:Hydroxylamine reductase n=1 Tax=Methanoplanus endosymbiosus TaxID=33865 RepID=A0A9E7PLI0_9EURY|nr:hydroxylamine reductase [Methanoplanus endosymbiosus]UUX92125.1 hydroxylamine reductase [Methanoplanus endosymbiosus]